MKSERERVRASRGDRAWDAVIKRVFSIRWWRRNVNCELLSFAGFVVVGNWRTLELKEESDGWGETLENPLPSKAEVEINI